MFRQTPDLDILCLHNPISSTQHFIPSLVSIREDKTFMSHESHDRGPEFLAIFGTGAAIAAIVVILRVWIRVRILRKVGIDDWVVSASLVTTWVFMFPAIVD